MVHIYIYTYYIYHHPLRLYTRGTRSRNPLPTPAHDLRTTRGRQVHAVHHHARSQGSASGLSVSAARHRHRAAPPTPTHRDGDNRGHTRAPSSRVGKYNADNTTAKVQDYRASRASRSRARSTRVARAVRATRARCWPWRAAGPSRTPFGSAGRGSWLQKGCSRTCSRRPRTAPPWCRGSESEFGAREARRRARS